jgi:hypothetical protein
MDVERGWGCTLCRLEDPPRTGVGVGMVGLATACLEHLVDAWRREEFSRNNTSTEHE